MKTPFSRRLHFGYGSEDTFNNLTASHKKSETIYLENDQGSLQSDMWLIYPRHIVNCNPIEILG